MKAFLLTALIASAALPAFADSPQAAVIDKRGVVPPQLAGRSVTQVVPFTPATCSALMQTTRHIGGVPLMRLDELPPGLLEHAVLRTVGGCPVREVVWNGQTYYVAPTSPAVLDANPARGPRIKQR